MARRKQNVSRNQAKHGGLTVGILPGIVEKKSATEPPPERPTRQFFRPAETQTWNRPRILGKGVTLLRGDAEHTKSLFDRGVSRTVRVLLTVGSTVHSIDYQLLNTLVGRHSVCDVKIKSEFTSRVHASFIIRKDGFHLIDSSKNGTYVQTDSGEVYRLQYNLRFPMVQSGVISFGAPCSKASDWLVQYACRQQ